MRVVETKVNQIYCIYPFIQQPKPQLGVIWWLTYLSVYLLSAGELSCGEIHARL